jgi:hypothetical protein
MCAAAAYAPEDVVIKTTVGWGTHGMGDPRYQHEALLATPTWCSMF